MLAVHFTHLEGGNRMDTNFGLSPSVPLVPAEGPHWTRV